MILVGKEIFDWSRKSASNQSEFFAWSTEFSDFKMTPGDGLWTDFSHPDDSEMEKSVINQR